MKKHNKALEMTHTLKLLDELLSFALVAVVLHLSLFTWFAFHSVPLAKLGTQQQQQWRFF